MKVGIAVSSINGAVDCDDEDLFMKSLPIEEGIEIRRDYGDPFTVVVYIGSITHFGDDFFEYDINTIPGCSGATVFLLDQQQPDLVLCEDYGTVIGVHAGHAKGLQSNVAFKLPHVQPVKSDKWGCFGRMFGYEK